MTGILLLYFTYNTNEKDDLSKFKSDSADKVQNNKKNAEEKVIEAEKKNKFLDVEYRGIDLSGNRFLIKSGEAEFLVEGTRRYHLLFVGLLEGGDRQRRPVPQGTPPRQCHPLPARAARD